MVAGFRLGKTTIAQITRVDAKKIKENMIKEWHFERCERGVKPVEGKCDPNNPKHIKEHKPKMENMEWK